MNAIIDGELRGDARREAMGHIEGCETCMARMRELAGLEMTLAEAWAKFREEECLSPETLLAYSEGELSDAERRKAEEHLAQCEVCSLVLEESAELEKEYVRQEEQLLKDNRQRLGSRLYEKVKDFLAERFSEAQGILEKADAFQFNLKPVPVFRGKKPPETRVPRIPVQCRSGSLIIAVTGRDPRTTRLRVVDEKGETIAEESCSTEGIAAFFDLPAGFYSVEVVDE